MRTSISDQLERDEQRYTNDTLSTLYTKREDTGTEGTNHSLFEAISVGGEHR